MVDESLLNEIREMREKGYSGPSDVLKLFEVAKQLSTESEDMREEIEDMDSIAVQLVMNDIDFKWWVKMGEGSFEYGEGEIEFTVSLITSHENWRGMLGGEVDATSLYMGGDLSIEGNLQDAMAFGEVLGMMREEL